MVASTAETELSHGLRRRTTANAIAAAVQAAVGGLVVFATYKFLVIEIGAAGIGAWSLALTISTIATLPGVGIQGAMQHFVAVRAIAGDLSGAADVIMTSLLAVAALVGFGSVVVVLAAPHLLPMIVGSSASGSALELMPWGASSGWLLIMCAGLQAGLDGVQKATMRAWMFLGATVFYMAAAMVLTRYFGLVGLGWANVIEYSLLFGCLALGVGFYFAKRGVRRARFRLSILRQMLVYSAGSQALGIAAVVFDPLAKSLLGHYSGLASIGLFDMASRMLVQFRGVVVGACGILISIFFAPRTIEADEVMRRRYMEVLGLVTSAAVVFVLGAEATSLALAIVWLGGPSVFFVETVALLTVGWGLNMVTVPAYMVQMGYGTLRWNVVGQYVSLGVLGLLGVVLAGRFQGPGLVLAYTLALVAGGLVPLVYLHRAMRVTMREWIGLMDWGLVLYALAACIVGWAAYGCFRWIHPGFGAPALLAAFMIVLLVGVFRSRTRHAITVALWSRRKND